MQIPTAPANAWQWSEITGLLKAVIADPKTAINRSEARLRAYAGRMDAPDAPLLLALDMPSGFRRVCRQYQGSCR